MASQSAIKVVVRVRPLSSTENARLAKSISSTQSPKRVQGRGSLSIRNIVSVVDTNMLILDSRDPHPSSSQRDKRYVFDHVFGPSASQNDVFNGSTQPLLDSLFQGYNSTVFAYGATGCGKTHTISGSNDQPGLIFQAVEALFSQMNKISSHVTCSLTLSYLEIYNEKIRDLLCEDAEDLRIREDAKKIVRVSNLSEHTPTCMEEVMALLKEGNSRRKMAATAANNTSSRSHAVLQLRLRQVDRVSGLSEEQTVSTLSIIDLAGSERAASTQNRGQQLVEGANINRSLLALGKCINALCQHRSHIPYRESNLTRLLKFSLDGNCKTTVIACISPCSLHYDDTHNTLAYAERTKGIKTSTSRCTVSVDRHVRSYVLKISEQHADLVKLRAEVERLGEIVKASEIAQSARQLLLRIQNESDAQSHAKDLWVENTFRRQTLESDLQRLKRLMQHLKTRPYGADLDVEDTLQDQAQEWKRSLDELEPPSAIDWLYASVERAKREFASHPQYTASSAEWLEAKCEAILERNRAECNAALARRFLGRSQFEEAMELCLERRKPVSDANASLNASPKRSAPYAPDDAVSPRARPKRVRWGADSFSSPADVSMQISDSSFS